MHRYLVTMLLVSLATGCTRQAPDQAREASTSRDTLTVRVATYNLEDVRTQDLMTASQPRLVALAAEIQRAHPDILFVNEMAYDQHGAPGVRPNDPEGLNAQRFARKYLSEAQGPGLTGIRYQAFMAPVNTGLASGYDLDHDGAVVDSFPSPPPPGRNGEPGEQTAEGRRYGDDAWGFGTFPGQYGMALLVREGLDVVAGDVRTFRLLRWGAMPGALAPVDPVTGLAWYDADVWAHLRLSSKSHWDVPVRLPNGTVLHVLASHPTPPAFDGAEKRNARRNHDEIRFWSDYLSGAAYVRDDSSRAGGLSPAAPFVIVGDLNADVDEGTSVDDPIGRFLLRQPRVRGDLVPQAAGPVAEAFAELSPDDTAVWGLHVDYVLPSTDLTPVDSRVQRPRPDAARALRPTDHFLVWVDLAVPPGMR